MDLLVLLIIILVVAWALGFFAFHVTSGLLHLLLLIALIVIVVRLFTGRRVI